MKTRAAWVNGLAGFSVVELRRGLSASPCMPPGTGVDTAYRLIELPAWHQLEPDEQTKLAAIVEFNCRGKQ